MRFLHLALGTVPFHFFDLKTPMSLSIRCAILLLYLLLHLVHDVSILAQVRINALMSIAFHIVGSRIRIILEIFAQFIMNY